MGRSHPPHTIAVCPLERLHDILGSTPVLAHFDQVPDNGAHHLVTKTIRGGAHDDERSHSLDDQLPETATGRCTFPMTAKGREVMRTAEVCRRRTHPADVKRSRPCKHPAPQQRIRAAGIVDPIAVGPRASRKPSIKGGSGPSNTAQRDTRREHARQRTPQPIKHHAIQCSDARGHPVPPVLPIAPVIVSRRSGRSDARTPEANSEGRRKARKAERRSKISVQDLVTRVHSCIGPASRNGQHRDTEQATQRVLNGALNRRQAALTSKAIPPLPVVGKQERQPIADGRPFHLRRGAAYASSCESEAPPGREELSPSPTTGDSDSGA